MKTIHPRKSMYGRFTEKYALTELYVGRRDIQPGLLVCYLTAVSPDLTLESFFGDEEGEIGAPHRSLRMGADEFRQAYPTPEAFFQQAGLAGIQSWELMVRVGDIRVKMFGHAWLAEISMIYPSAEEIRFPPLLVKVEEASYFIHSYEEAFLSRVRQQSRLTQKAAIRILDQLKRYPDLFEEFQDGCRENGFVFPEQGIVVEGYDARTLGQDYPMSPLGAYHYLLYLRETPEEALKKLKEGLPRR